MGKTRGEGAPRRAGVITVRPKPGNKSRAILTFGGMSFDAAIGRNGRTSCKREGDGKTPVAAMKLLYGYVRGERVRAMRTALPMRRVRPSMLWCDAPAHPAYNRPVSAPFAASHEELQRADELYDICIVLDWNVTSRRRNGGSAIFFHLIRPGYEPTAGCVALSRRDMLRILPHLRRGTVLKVV